MGAAVVWRGEGCVGRADLVMKMCCDLAFASWTIMSGLICPSTGLVASRSIESYP